jgi:transglutaminase-like putative cysteine protease
VAWWLVFSVAAFGQFRDADPRGPRPGETAGPTWRIGVIVTAGGPCRGIVATTSVPTDWPEQQVRVVGDAISRGARVTYQTIDDAARQPAARQMTVRIASLPPGQEARAVATFEVKRTQQSAPADTDVYVLPDPRRSDRKLRGYLAPSPYIESTHPQIEALAGEVGVDEPHAWDRVEAIYDWVRREIQLEDDRGRGVKTTLETLRDGKGDCDELTSLFIAICRAGGVPARTVRVPGHCYPEFYLEDDQGKGHWFPCDPTRPGPFGEVTEDRPVLQKGDNLRLVNPRTRRARDYRFLPDNVTMADQRGSPPQVQWVLERVPAE